MNTHFKMLQRHAQMNRTLYTVSRTCTLTHTSLSDSAVSHSQSERTGVHNHTTPVRFISVSRWLSCGWRRAKLLLLLFLMCCHQLRAPPNNWWAGGYKAWPHVFTYFQDMMSFGARSWQGANGVLACTNTSSVMRGARDVISESFGSADNIQRNVNT